MLERYTLHPMGAFWSEQTKLNLWRDISVLAVVARENVTIRDFDDYPAPKVADVQLEEQRTRHDVAAFLNVWRATLPARLASLVHLGMTSSDLVDATNALRIQMVTDEIDRTMRVLVGSAASQAIAYWNLQRLARTHGQPAEVTTWGYRLATLLIPIERSRSALANKLFPVKLSGPVGTYRHTSFEQEMEFAQSILLSLVAATCSTQIVSRDAYAMWASRLAVAATCIEALAMEIRLSQRFEVNELTERRAPDQVGSSAMPHKVNPIRCEQMSGLAKMVRAQVIPMMEGIVQHNEHDIAHSSVERLAMPTASTLVHYMARTMTDVMDRLQINSSRMELNIAMAGDRVNTSSYVVQLIQHGVPVETAHTRVKQLFETFPERRRIWVALKEEFGIELSEPPPMRVDHVRDQIEKLASRKITSSPDGKFRQRAWSPTTER